MIIAPGACYTSIKHAADLLISAVRPAIVIGKGVRWSEPYQELNSLSERLWATDSLLPQWVMVISRMTIPSATMMLEACFDVKADVVLLLGARLDWSFRFGSEFAPDVKLIQIDMILQRSASTKLLRSELSATSERFCGES